MKLRDLAARLGCRLEGDGDIEIGRVAAIHDAGPGDLTFVANPKYEKALSGTRASAVILGGATAMAPCAVLRSDEPYLAFARAVAAFAPDERPAPGVHPLTAVAPDATLGRDVSIGAFVAVGAGASIGHRTVVYPNVTIGPGARIGDDCVVHANVSIRERVVLGHRVVLQDGVVLGGDGYGFVRRPDGTHEKIPQVAAVVIEDDVEIGANTTVDRPAVGETRIKAGAKIDNLVQVGHGVSIGRNALMAAQVGISGSTNIGDDVVFGGQVGVGGHLTIGKGAIAVGQSGVTNSLDAGARVAGYPAIDNQTWRRASVLFKHLPELKRRIDALEAELEALKAPAPEEESGTMIRTWGLAVLLMTAASVATPQSIQLAPLQNSQAPADNPEGTLLFLPNYHFHLNMAHLSSDSPRFNWDANYGGEFGIVAYGQTQLTFVANYQAVPGEEFHPFDPNQGNYTIDGVLSTRIKGVYVAGVFHHLSRHLADRAKRPPVDWNMMGGRVGTQFTRGGTEVEARFDLLGSILKTNVDYDWELHTGIRVHRRVYGTVGLIGAAQLRYIGTSDLFHRGNQTGGRGEGGFRVSGRAATVELYLAVERVIDAYPTVPGTDTMASVGMRLLSR